MMLALDNHETVLSAAGMDLTNVIWIDIDVTDVDERMKNFDVFGARFGSIGAPPPESMLGVTRLAIPPFMFEITATAAD
ncbi:MAG: enamine deaminase RidA (YjgF/YER057c/UK114 family) [Candidatus Aldehydirespiratoraceae bacterium]|jgi:enamine deaminase RidA (YjgF/YER057c/UK114 family)